MITPTVGRIVWFQDGVRPAQAAIITHVWSDVMVNLCVFDPNGIPFAKTSITLVQDYMTSPSGTPFCEWMPYQKGQAAKTEAVEAQLKVSNG